MKHLPLAGLASLLLVCGTALAQQAPQQAPPEGTQAQSETAPAQPAAPAPQPASAEEAARCQQAVGDVFDSMSNGDYAGAVAKFEPKLKLDEDKLKETWKQLNEQFGDVGSVGEPLQANKVSNYTVVVLPVDAENDGLAAQAACDSDGLIASLRFAKLPPAGASQAPKPKT